MKKAIIILAIITAGAAHNFAQTPAEPVLEQQAVAAAAVAEPAIQPADPVAETAADDRMGADEIVMDEELGEDAMIQEGRISLRLKDAELKDVIRMFSALSDANIIVPELSKDEGGSDRKIDVNLENVEWQPALEAILDTQALELHEKIPASKVYSIRKKTPGAPEATELKIFKLDFASVGTVSNLVSGMVGPIGSVSVFPERNVLVVQATAKTMQGIEMVMQQVDKPREQVFIESKFLELSDSAQRDLGINWQVLSGYEIGVSGINGSYSYQDSKLDEYRRSTTSRDTDSSYSGQTSSENIFTDIEGRTYEALSGEPAEGQIEWDARPGNNPENVRILNLIPTTASGSSSDNYSESLTETLIGDTSLDAATVARTLGATLSASDFKVILSALEQEDGIDVVSNPKIIVANEEEATIHIGNKEPNITVEQRRGTQDNPGGELAARLDLNEPYFYDGVKVVVTPTVNNASNIMVRITPELTTFIDHKEVKTSTGVTLVDYPISRTKKIDTMFSLQSGQTAAIGGLTQVTDSMTANKIPLLGNLPFIGRLFSYEQKVRDQNETIIFVTVSLANPGTIKEDSGLPQDTQLAQRYQIRANANRRINIAEDKLYRTKENVEMKKELERLREANRKLIEEQKQNALDEEMLDTLDAEPIAGDLDTADTVEVDADVEAM